MRKAEMDKSVPPQVCRLSTWRCMRCSLPFSVQSKGIIFVSARESNPYYAVHLALYQYLRISLLTRMNLRTINRGVSARPTPRVTVRLQPPPSPPLT